MFNFGFESDSPFLLSLIQRKKSILNQNLSDKVKLAYIRSDLGTALGL